MQIEVRPTPLNRLAVLFRVFLMIPAAIVQSLAVYGWWALAFVWWLITLCLGRMPRPLFEATAATLRYRMRFSAYVMMLTPPTPRACSATTTSPWSRRGRAPSPARWS